MYITFIAFTYWIQSMVYVLDSGIGLFFNSLVTFKCHKITSGTASFHPKSSLQSPKVKHQLSLCRPNENIKDIEMISPIYPFSSSLSVHINRQNSMLFTLIIPVCYRNYICNGKALYLLQSRHNPLSLSEVEVTDWRPKPTMGKKMWFSSEKSRSRCCRTAVLY